MEKAIIFDMDGVLIDSEPFWQEVETELFQGLGLPYDENTNHLIQGLQLKEVVEYCYHHFPWTGKTQKQVCEEITYKIIHKIKTQGKALPGVYETIASLQQQGIRLALASSSSYELIKAVLSVLQLEQVFEVIRSAQDEEYGKPHPAVYLRTAFCLGLSPLACVAIEDSVNGVIAAKAARMKCIAVPSLQAQQNPKFSIADLVLPSLREFRMEI